MKQVSPEFTGFLMQANRNGYANEGPETRVLTNDGTSRLEFHKGLWSYYDQWVGGDPYNGLEWITYGEGDKKVPVWSMRYGGEVTDRQYSSDKVFTLLRIALGRPDSDLPVRGPKDCQFDSTTRYHMNAAGDLTEFRSGREEIYVNEGLVYVGAFSGGLVNLRRAAEAHSDTPWLESQEQV